MAKKRKKQTKARKPSKSRRKPPAPPPTPVPVVLVPFGQLHASHAPAAIAERKVQLLQKLSEGYTQEKAAVCVGISRQTLFNYRKKDKKFDEYCEDALKHGNSLLIDEAFRRAVHGVLEPVFYKGEICGYVRKYSDPLMIKLLTSRVPEVYGEKSEQTRTNIVEHHPPLSELIKQIESLGMPVPILETDYEEIDDDAAAAPTS